MLVLSRGLREKIVVEVRGVRFTVHVDRIVYKHSQPQFRLTFDAPREVEIWRDEIQRKIDDAEKGADRG